MAHKVDEHIGARIRAIRRALGISQEALAQRLGVTFQQVQKYERGLNRISASRLFDVAQVMETPVGDFFHGLAADEAQTTAQTYEERVTTQAGLKRLVLAYESLPTEWEREQLVQAAEVIARRPLD